MNFKNKVIYIAIITAISQQSMAFTQTVENAQSISDEIVTNGTQNVLGIANHTTVSINGIQEINALGQTNGTIVESGGKLTNNYGTDNNTIVKAGGDYKIDAENNYNIPNGEKTTTSNSMTIETGHGEVYVKNANLNDWIINGNNNDVVTIEATNSNVQGGTKTNDLTLNGGDLNFNKSTSESTVVNRGRYINNGSVDIDMTVRSTGSYYMGGTDSANSLGTVLSGMNLGTGANAYIQHGAVSGVINIDGAMYLESNVLNGKLNGDSRIISGEFNVRNSGKLSLSGVQDSSSTINNSGELIIKSYSYNPFDNNYQSLSNLYLQSGKVIFDNSLNFSDLHVKNLTGEGDFYMNTDISNQKGDKIVITEGSTGSFGLYVSDTGKSPTTKESLNLVKDENGTADFTLKNKDAIVEIGTYQYKLKNDDKGNWDLVLPSDTGTPEEPKDPKDPIISTSAAGILSMATVAPIMDRQQINTISTYLNERQNVDSKVWSAYSYGKDRLHTDAGSGVKLSTNGVTVGVDKQFYIADDQMILSGLFLSFQNSDVDFNRGGKGKAKSYSVGSYSQWNKDNYFIDGIVKLSHFRNDLSPIMNSGNKTHGNYSHYGFSGDLKAGYKYELNDSINISPYVGLSGFTANSKTYTLDNEMTADVKRSQVYKTELGLKTDLKIEQATPYIKVYTGKEFGSKNDVYINSNDKFSNDTNGYYYGIQSGVVGNINHSTSIGANVAYRNGHKTESPITLNLTLSYSY